MRPDRAVLEGWLASELEHETTPVALVAACARRLARDAGLSVDEAPPLLAHGAGLQVPADAELTAWSLGPIYERALDWEHRRREGVHFTPQLVAHRLAEIGLAPHPGAATVCDPSVGGGAFLLAAAEVLVGRRLPRRFIVEELLWGIDIDPVAVDVANAAVALWGSDATSGWVAPGDHLAVADTLRDGASVFGDRTFAAVIGNPPFQNQLGAETARRPVAGKALRGRWAVETGPYADTSAFFLLAGIELAAERGSVVLVQPQSLLGASNVAAVRDHVAPALAGLWVAGDDVFDANVRVCAPVLRKGGGGGPVQRWVGATVDEVASIHATTDPTWSPLVGDLLGVPEVKVRGERVIGDIAEATAGFRQQFYGLANHTVEAQPGAERLPLVTVGMIDPLRNRWGTTEFRFAGKRWTSPCVDLPSLESADPSLAAWVDQRRSPKLLVATQTKVIEVVVDATGDLVPSTPTIAVTAPPEMLWKLAAALTSPVLAALAFSRVAGTALASQAIKLSAAQVLTLPLPTDDVAWERGAQLARRAAQATAATEWLEALDAMAAEMCAAYELADGAEALCSWWRERRPAWR